MGLFWIIVIATSIWVLIDAKTIGVKKGQIQGMGNLGPSGWFFACLLLWIIGFPFYLAKRSEFKRINSAPPQERQNVAAAESAQIKGAISVIGWVGIIFFGGIALLLLFGERNDGTTGIGRIASGGVTKAYKLQETAHVGYTSYAVWKAFYRNQLSDNQYLNEPPDAAYLFVDLTVRNDDTKARSIAPFKLVDENGAVYETSSKAWSVDGSIGILDSLNPSVEKRGYIVFDVPQGKHYKLEISGGYWSSDKALVDLGV
jgi:hypothetical protein